MSVDPALMLLVEGLKRGLPMRVVPGRQERLAGLFVVVGSTIVFARLRIVLRTGRNMLQLTHNV
jgi:hypothetical protein